MAGVLQPSSPLHNESCPPDICLVSGFVLQQIVCHASKCTPEPLQIKPVVTQVGAWQQAAGATPLAARCAESAV
jgi:hypothetical protein